MARVALVTGGSRGIGAAISVGLKKLVTLLLPITPVTMKPLMHSRKKPAYRPINGTFQIMTRASLGLQK